MTSTEEQEEVLISKRGRIAQVTINRPARRNALSAEVVARLIEAFSELGLSREVGAIVLTGAGEEAFCAGGDLSGQAMSEGALAMHHQRGGFAELLRAMNRSTKPIVARVNGHALGGGFGLMLSCDLVVASGQATFGTPEIKLGLFPMMIMAVIARNLGRKHAMRMMLTGERLDAERALAIGALNEVADPQQLDERTEALAERVAGFSPAALRLGRQAFYATQDMSFDQALDHLQAQLTINAMTEDASEGIMAFLDKRDPEWKGR